MPGVSEFRELPITIQPHFEGGLRRVTSNRLQCMLFVRGSICFSFTFTAAAAIPAAARQSGSASSNTVSACSNPGVSSKTFSGTRPPAASLVWAAIWAAFNTSMLHLRARIPSGNDRSLWLQGLISTALSIAGLFSFIGILPPSAGCLPPTK